MKNAYYQLVQIFYENYYYPLPRNEILIEQNTSFQSQYGNEIQKMKNVFKIESKNEDNLTDTVIIFSLFLIFKPSFSEFGKKKYTDISIFVFAKRDEVIKETNMIQRLILLYEKYIHCQSIKEICPLH